MKRLALALALLLALGRAGGAAAAQPLVDVDWVKAHGGDPGVVLLDIRYATRNGASNGFAEGHIPGAISADYATAGWRTTRDGVIGMLPPVADLEGLIGGLGITRDSHVVVISHGKTSSDMGAATRVYWTFKVLGHDQVSVLDGGYAAWTAEPGNPIGTDRRTPAATVYKADFQPQLVASREDVAEALKAGVRLIDNRPAEQYAGASKHPRAGRAGTIPTAVNLQQQDLTVEGGGGFVSLARLNQLLASVGIRKEGDQITFCNTGHWASIGWFALSEIGGNKKTRLYDGSMVDWTADPADPVVQPAAKAN